MHKIREWQRYGQLLLLAMSAGAMFRLIYLRTSMQEAMQVAFDIDVVRVNELYFWLGVAIVGGYVPSGWLADRFSTKKLVIAALLVTACLALWLAFLPSFAWLRIIYFGLGLSSVFLFWSAHIRSAKLLSTAEAQEGKLFGWLEGLRGMSEALMGTLAVVLFGWASQRFVQHYDNHLAMRLVFLLFAAVQVLLAIVNIFCLDKDRSEKITSWRMNKTKANKMVANNDRVSRRLLIQVLMVSMIIFSGYTLFFVGFSFSDLLISYFQQPKLQVAYFLSVALWMRPVGAIGGGFIADRVSKNRLLMVSMSSALVGLLLVLYMPMPIYVRLALLLGIALANSVTRGVYWSLLAYLEIPQLQLGRTIGVISFIGYLPDVLLPLLSVHLYSQIASVNEATLLYIHISIVIGVLGLIALKIFDRQLNNS